MDATRTRKRPWYRLHLSTYLVLLVPLSVLVLVGVAGYGEGVFLCAMGRPPYRSVEHGWPLVHMDRTEEDDLAPEAIASAEEGFRSESLFRWATKTGNGGDLISLRWGWNEAANWKQTGSVVIVRKVALAVNLLVAAAICAAITGPYEWWRRRRFRYSLRSLLVLFVAVAAILGWWRWRANQHDREVAAIEQLEKLGYGLDCQYRGPIWLARLVGEQRLHFFLSANTSEYVPPDPFGKSKPEVADGRKVIDLATELDTLTAVGLHGDLKIEDAQWAGLTGMKNLEELYVEETRISDFGIACLAKLPKLRVLVVTKLDDASVAKLRRALPKCEITGPVDAAPKPGEGFF